MLNAQDAASGSNGLMDGQSPSSERYNGDNAKSIRCAGCGAIIANPGPRKRHCNGRCRGLAQRKRLREMIINRSEEDLLDIYLREQKKVSQRPHQSILDAYMKRVLVLRRHEWEIPIDAYLVELDRIRGEVGEL